MKATRRTAHVDPFPPVGRILGKYAFTSEMTILLFVVDCEVAFKPLGKAMFCVYACTQTLREGDLSTSMGELRKLKLIVDSQVQYESQVPSLRRMG